MIRGTTPRLKLKLKNCDVSLLKNIYVTFKQSRYANKTLEKTGNDVIIDKSNNILIINLSQDDTLYFDVADVEIQIRATTINGAAVASEIVREPVKRILKRGVIE